MGAIAPESPWWCEQHRSVTDRSPAPRTKRGMAVPPPRSLSGSRFDEDLYVEKTTIIVRLWEMPVRDMTMKSDIQVIKEEVSEIKKLLNDLIHQNETIGMMKLSERSLHQFLQDEPDIYTLDDAKVVYR